MEEKGDKYLNTYLKTKTKTYKNTRIVNSNFLNLAYNANIEEVNESVPVSNGLKNWNIKHRTNEMVDGIECFYMLS